MAQAVARRVVRQDRVTPLPMRAPSARNYTLGQYVNPAPTGPLYGPVLPIGQGTINGAISGAVTGFLLAKKRKGVGILLGALVGAIAGSILVYGVNIGVQREFG